MYQTIRHTHYQQNGGTRSIEDFLNLLRMDHNEKKLKWSIISLALVKVAWSEKHYEVLHWHLIIQSSHIYTDDELSPMLYEEDDE